VDGVPGLNFRVGSTTFRFCIRRCHCRGALLLGAKTVFIQTEQTPNPATLKFLPGRPVVESGTANFPEATSAARSPLAQRLFDVAGVTGVFLGSDFVTITKDEDREWYLLKPAILGVIMEHFTAGRPVLLPEDAPALSAEDDGEVDEVVSQIKELLDTRVRPAVAQDGGDIVFHGFEDGVVYLHMQGACAGCPSSTATLKMGIENMLRHYIPEVLEVRAIA
jgi:Fe-S cluster biogenesis protein NfuA